MKLNSVLAFVAALLFAIAGVINLINGASARGAVGCIGALSFLLAGLHWHRNAKKSRD